MQREQTRHDFFNKHAEGWEVRNYSADKRDRLQELLEDVELRPGATVLDVGCGEGVLIPYLRKRLGDNARIIALDPSPVMLKGAAAKDQGRALIVRAKAEDMPLIDEYVDAVICFAAFPHFSDKSLAVQEFYRVLKPGGQAYVLHLGSREEINQHHDGHHTVKGDHLPCPVGMKMMFTEAGFQELDLVEKPGWYFFRASK